MTWTNEKFLNNLHTFCLTSWLIYEISDHFVKNNSLSTILFYISFLIAIFPLILTICLFYRGLKMEKGKMKNKILRKSIYYFIFSLLLLYVVGGNIFQNYTNITS